MVGEKRPASKRHSVKGNMHYKEARNENKR